MKELDQFIESNPDSRELKRALAVRMTLKGYSHRAIMKILQVCSGFISKWKEQYIIIHGIEALKLGHKGSVGYLSKEEKTELFQWLNSQESLTLGELEYHIAQKYGVTYEAKSSYYDLFNEGQISWKKSQKKNPQKNQDLVDKKKEEIQEYIEKNKEKIESGKLKVFFKEEEWLVKCIKLAPNAPEQNPIEDVWLQGKEILRKYWNICKTFKIVKWLFQWAIKEHIFSFPKLSMYASFS